MHLDPPKVSHLSSSCLLLPLGIIDWRKLQAGPGFTWQETLPPKPEFGSRRALEHTPIQLISSEKSEIVSQESSRFVVRVSFIRMSLLKCSRGGSKSSRGLSQVETRVRNCHHSQLSGGWTKEIMSSLSGPTCANIIYRDQRLPSQQQALLAPLGHKTSLSD